MNGDGRRADFRLRIRAVIVAQDAPRDKASRNLNLLAAVVVELGDADLGIAADAKEIGIVELQFGAAAGCDGAGSPAIRGPFRTAATQSPESARRTEASPLITPRRATG
jgi:hypothetical protein